MAALKTESCPICSHNAWREHLSLAIVDQNLRIVAKDGNLSHPLPDIGGMICDSPLFLGMEPQFTALRKRAITQLNLPSLRLQYGERWTPLSALVNYDDENENFFVLISVDYSANEFERQLTQERREITVLEEQARAAGKLIKEQAALYKNIVESSHDLVLRLRADLRLTFVNQAMLTRLCRKPIEVLGYEIDLLLNTPMQQSRWSERVHPDGVSSFEQALIGPDGETRWIWWTIHWLGHTEGPGEYQAVGRDITDLRRLRAEAERGAAEAKLTAVMRERLSIARDLHDTLVQSLVSLAPQLRLIRKVAGGTADIRLLEEITHAEDAVREGLTHARAALAQLREQNRASEGLGAAIERAVERFSARTGVNVVVDIDQQSQRLEGEIADALCAICKEALRNVELHAQAQRVGIYILTMANSAVSMVIADDGRGFDAGTTPKDHFGLIGMRERAEMIGAQFSIQSEPNAGTRVKIEMTAQKKT